MNNQTKQRIVALLAAAALSVPFTTAWAATGPSNTQTALSAYMIFGRGTPGVQTQTARLVPLTLSEVKALGLPEATAYSANALQAAFASPAFQRVWQRTDQLVASGAEKRSWYWGPVPISGALQEDYAEGPGGKRLVQYFDKSRMEINNPNGDPNSPFFVTNGLLTVELISGKMQVGNSAYTDRWSADIPLASDPDDPTAPTYLSFRNVSNTPLGDHPAASAMNRPATATIARDGTVGNDPNKSTYPDVTVSYFEPTTKHNIPKAIWDFLNAQGNVIDPVTGRTVAARLSDPWFYATGFPISEAYWARVKIAGQPQDVLIQAFERRVVTYVPNGVPGFKVQMGNIGQHYYDWRYKDAGKPAGGGPPPPPPQGTPPVQPTPPPGQPTNTPAPPSNQCVNIPPSQNATVTPNCGPGGTRFSFAGTGFRPGENVGVYVTAPDQSVLGAPFQADADSSGAVTGIYLDTGASTPPGIYAVTFEGTSSHNKAIGYFRITSNAPAATPTPGGGGGGGGGGSSCTDVPASQNMTIRPSNCAPPGTQFLFAGRGFQGGENVGVYVTDPSQAVYGAPFQITANSDGTAGAVSFTTQAGFPLGVWAMTMEGTSSHAKAIGYFKLIP